jgi:putative tryptophan/tyrosine transport system substrate-binding protein
MTARRAFLAIGLLAPFALRAQPRVSRIGYFDVRPTSVFPQRVAAFLDGLRALGYAEGRNLAIEFRTAGGRMSELPRLAAELLEARVHVIFAPTTVAALAARQASGTIPIVFAVPADPVGVKLVASLSRPGGNATGLTTNNVEVIPKRLEILTEISGASNVGLLFNPRDASNMLFARNAEEAGRRLGIATRPFPAGRQEEFAARFREISAARISAVLVAAGALMDDSAALIAGLAAEARVPALYGAPEFVRAGGLVSYSASFVDNFRRAASYVDRILKGARPADLPVEQASKFDYVINLKAAKALGLAIPPAQIFRASEVIE